MSDYLRIIGQFFPDSEVYITSTGSPLIYDDLIWNTTPIPQATLDSYINNVDPLNIQSPDFLISSKFSRKGTLTSGCFLLVSPYTPSNVMGKVISLAPPILEKINITTSQLNTFDMRIFYHDGNNVNPVDITIISIVNENSKILKRSTDYSILNQLIYGKQIGVEITSGTATDLKVELIISGK